MSHNPYIFYSINYIIIVKWKSENPMKYVLKWLTRQIHERRTTHNAQHTNRFACVFHYMVDGFLVVDPFLADFSDVYGHRIENITLAPFHSATYSKIIGTQEP